MKRLFTAILLLTLVTIAVPSLRARAAPRASATAAWVWGFLEPPLTPVLTPYRRMQTETRMARINSLLVRQRNQGISAPASDELPAFMVRGNVRDTLDAWGQPFDLEQTADSVYVRSAGPDTTLQTDDDLVSAVRYPEIRRAKRRRSR